MRQYEMSIRVAQVHHLVDERKYKKAWAVISLPSVAIRHNMMLHDKLVVPRSAHLIGSPRGFFRLSLKVR